MKRTAIVAGLVVFICALPNAAPQQDALALLRAALGGEAALSAVQTIKVRATIDADSHTDHMDVAVALPDRFIRTTRYFRPENPVAWLAKARGELYQIPVRGVPPGVVEGPIDSYSGQQVIGFNRQAPVPAPNWYELEQHPERPARRLDRAHARFAEFVLPLLADTSEAYPLNATSEANAVIFRAVDGRTWRLELDPVTHLPARLMWISQLRTDAAATLTPDEWRAEFCEFRPVGGLRWPHHVITRRNDEPYEDVRIKQYELNVTLSDKVFRK